MSKKIYLYAILILVALGVLYYYLDLNGLFAGLLGLGGAGGAVFKKKQNELEQLEVAIEKQVDEIEKEKKKLQESGVEEKTDQEEVDYWKNQ